MNNVEMYFLKVNIAIALFYLVYRFVFYNDTFWAARRYYMIFSMLLSLVYPFISLAGWLEKQEPIQNLMATYVNLADITVRATPPSMLTFENGLIAIYALTVLFFGIKMVLQLVSILRWRMKGKKETVQGVEIVAIDDEITPFSFFNLIFMNPALHTEAETKQILAHEQTHVRQMHSLDVLLSELLTIVCWFNPAAWLLKREIRQNLEFLADNNVLQSGFDTRDYQYHLLQLSYQIPNIPLVNKFNVLPIKKRIIMMNQQKSAKAGLLKYSLIVPLALVLVLSSNAGAVVNKTKSIVTTVKNQVVTETKDVNNVSSNFTDVEKATDKPENEKVFMKVDKMPQYGDGDKSVMEYIAMNIKYPVEAQKSNTQGKVLVRFIVNASGKVVKPEILKGVSSSLDQEALRVVNTMPDWIPGESKDQKVSVYYTVPIDFKIDDGTQTISTPTKNTVTVTAYNNGHSIAVKPIDPKNPPVVVIDGKIMPSGFDLNSIEAQKIESVNVIKTDSEKRKAELIAQYGSEAVNGVILIVTKKNNDHLFEFKSRNEKIISAFFVLM